MCGIGGYFVFGDKKPNKRSLDNLLISMESRGSDATGISFIDEAKKLTVIKDNVKATDFVNYNTMWKNLQNIPNYMILHTRAATKGLAINSNNNHPIYRSGLALVHNGVITNDDSLYEKHKFKRDGQVDTEIILALLEKNRTKIDWLDRVKELNDLNGSFAVAAIDNLIENTICLFKHGSPIVFGIDRKNDILYFASTEGILKKSIVNSYRGISDISEELYFYDLPNDTGMVIDKNGCNTTFKLDITYTKYEGNYKSNYAKHKNTSLAVNPEHGKENCVTCSKFDVCPNNNFNTVTGVIIKCGAYTKNQSDTDIKPKFYDYSEKKDACIKCKVKDACEQPSDIERGKFESIKHLVCKKLTNNPQLYCSDCIFMNCIQNSVGKGKPEKCANFKYKSLATDYNKKCKQCKTYADCFDKFNLDKECSSFESNIVKCEYLEYCKVCDPLTCNILMP